MIGGATNKRTLKGSALRNLMFRLSVVLAVIVLGLAGYYVYRAYTDWLAEQSRGALKTRAEMLAQQVANRLSDNLRMLETLSHDAGLIKLLQEGDSARMATKAEELLGQFKYALNLRLLLPGSAKVDLMAIPPLSYASLEMLRRAETTDAAIAAEFHMFGGPYPHVAMVQRVQDHAGKLVGLIHLSMDKEMLQSAISSLGLTDGYVELHQPIFTGAPFILAKSSDTRPASLDSGQSAEAPVPGTRWSIVYWPLTSGTQGAISQVLSEPSLVGLTVVGLTLAGGLIMGFLFVIGRRPATPSGDTAVYQGAVKAIMEGDHPGLEYLVPHLPRRPRSNHRLPPPSIGDDTIPNLCLTNPLKEDLPVVSGPVQSVEPVAFDSIFRAYDIRGVVGQTLTEEVVYKVGLAIGSEAHERGQQSIVVARDGRISSPALSATLIRGLRESGRDVIDIGMVPTPVLYFATHYLNTGNGVMVTGSHNPPNYNGLKIMLDGQALSGEAIMAIHDRIQHGALRGGAGELYTVEIRSEYIRRITEDVLITTDKAFKVVVDCGNGVTGELAPRLLRALGHEVIELYCDIDGTFPNHHPDPSQPENLKALIETVLREQADLGMAFDGDGDRLGVIDGAGNIIWPDRQMMLFAKDVLSRNPHQQIIFDVKCSSHLQHFIEAHGGKPVMWKTGHSLIKAKMKESNAPLAGEMSGHIFFKERWYGFDDALYAAARLLEILVKDKRTPTEVFAELPGGVATPELRLAMPEPRHAQFMETLIHKATFKNAERVTVDGLRVNFPDGWGLIRPSNTSPYLILRFEADNEAALARIQASFRELLLKIDPELKLPF